MGRGRAERTGSARWPPSRPHLDFVTVRDRWSQCLLEEREGVWTRNGDPWCNRYFALWAAGVSPAEAHPAEATTPPAAAARLCHRMQRLRRSAPAAEVERPSTRALTMPRLASRLRCRWTTGLPRHPHSSPTLRLPSPPPPSTPCPP